MEAFVKALTFTLIVVIISIFHGVSFADDRSEKLSVINNGALFNALDAADELLSSKDQMTRSLAMEECLKSKERRLREVGFKYFIKNIKNFVVEINIPKSKEEELIGFDRAQNNGGRFKDLLLLHSIYVETRDMDDNNQFYGSGTKLGNINGMIANGSLKLFFPYYCDVIMSFNYVDGGYILGSLTIPNNSFSVKIPLQ